MKKILALLIALTMALTSVWAFAESGMGTPPDGMGTPPDGMGTPPDGMGTPPDGMGAPPDGMGAPPDGANGGFGGSIKDFFFGDSKNDTSDVHYCPHCGYPIVDDFDYCPKCGKPLK